MQGGRRAQRGGGEDQQGRDVDVPALGHPELERLARVVGRVGEEFGLSATAR
jgi:hypothetical protein